MAQYIERAKVTDALIDNTSIVGDLLVEAVNAICDIPAAEVRLAVKGNWIWDDEGYHCSECFYHAYGETGEVLSGNWHFCPYCGSEMREVN